ncbi:ABC transporter substrate-binding protein [Ensifer adhaerens]|uniref:ABC transporter substrate-binding protein n=1 Tax=Ensifer adhaerens TaxID=106592 RepID=UPI000DC2B5F0|nr:ABC transporter substrate-binding protein [Ensifer adhaerens]RAR99191.1 amino acid/amide ABC transporter substrate-binding protein (HAAT family) [Ensifer adhaerens]
MKYNNRYRTATVSAALMALMATTATARAEELVIGVATAQTGVLAPYDQPALAGLRYAIDEINARGGFGGKFQGRLVVKDTRSDTAQAATSAQELLDEGVKVMITPCDADPSIAIGQLTLPLEIATITLCGTAPVLTTAVGNVMFGSYPADNLQATVLAEYAVSEGKRTAYLLTSPDSTYTAGLPEYFAEVFEAKGGKVIERGTFTMGQPDFSAVVTKIKSLPEKPDMIMTAAFEPDFPAFIRQLRAAGVDVPVYGADALNTPSIKGLGKLVDGVVFTAAGYASPGSKVETFNNAFAKATGHPPESTYEVNGYEIGLIIDEAVRQSGSADPDAIRGAIASLKDFDSVTGKITYAGTSGMPIRSVVLMRYGAGGTQFISTLIPDAADVPSP